VVLSRPTADWASGDQPGALGVVLAEEAGTGLPDYRVDGVDDDGSSPNA
jgi:hypothetical protein